MQMQIQRRNRIVFIKLKLGILLVFNSFYSLIDHTNISQKNRLVKFTRKKNRLVSLSTFLLPLGVRLVILNLNFTTEEVI